MWSAVELHTPRLNCLPPIQVISDASMEMSRHRCSLTQHLPAAAVALLNLSVCDISGQPWKLRLVRHLIEAGRASRVISSGSSLSFILIELTGCAILQISSRCITGAHPEHCIILRGRPTSFDIMAPAPSLPAHSTSLPGDSERLDHARIKHPARPFIIEPSIPAAPPAVKWTDREDQVLRSIAVDQTQARQRAAGGQSLLEADTKLQVHDWAAFVATVQEKLVVELPGTPLRTVVAYKTRLQRWNRDSPPLKRAAGEA